MKKYTLAVIVLLLCQNVFADVALTDRTSALRLIEKRNSASPITPEQRAAIRAQNAAKRAAKQAKQHGHSLSLVSDAVSPLTPAERAAIRDANAAKTAAKHAKQHGHTLIPVPLSLHPREDATGSFQLVDAAGLKYFINDNITFSTSSSASAAASEASYQAPINASTSAGGIVMSTLSDMFDGYEALCVSLTNATGPCQTGNANYTMYNQNGPAAFDATVPAGATCTNRQVAFPAKTIGGLSVKRKVFVPTNDQYIRWMDIFTNTTGAPITFTMITSNNLGSDSNTRIVSSSSGDNVATVADKWVSTFQNYSGTTSSDPRIGHVLQGTAAPTPVSNINFVDGDDNPYWVYSITLAAGQTKMIVNFATGQGTKAAANAQANTLSAFGASAQQCMSNTELTQVVNFATNADLSITKTANQPSAFGGFAVSYTINVSNAGPSSATSVSVSDTLPAGSTFTSATGTGWVCNNVAGVVTCTRPTLAVGAAPAITLSMTAPPAAVPGTLVNTATVSSAATDSNPANNSSTSSIPILPGAQAPALSMWMLIALGLALGMIAIARRT